MISSVTKPKIPSGYSYVLKTTLLEQILIKNSIKTEAFLNYWRPQIIGSIFEVHFWLPNDRNPKDRLYIRAGAVLKKDVKSAREGLVNVVIPEFVEWIKKIEQLEKATSLKTERYFNAYYQNNQISLVKN